MFTYRVSYPFRIERIGKEFFQRNGQQQQLESDLPTPPQKLHFRIGSDTFIPPWVQPNQTAPNLPIFAANFFAQQLFFARLARPIQQIFILRSISRDKTSELHRKKKLKLGRTQMIVQHFSQKLIREIQSDNTCCEFFHELFHSSPQFRGIFFNSNKILLWNLETSSSWQTKNNHDSKVTNVLIKIVLNAIYDYFYTRTKLFDFYR